MFAEILNRTATGESVVRRLHIRDAVGAVHWIELHGKLFYDAAGNRTGATFLDEKSQPARGANGIGALTFADVAIATQGK